MHGRNSNNAAEGGLNGSRNGPVISTPPTARNAVTNNNNDMGYTSPTPYRPPQKRVSILTNSFGGLAVVPESEVPASHPISDPFTTIERPESAASNSSILTQMPTQVPPPKFNPFHSIHSYQPPKMMKAAIVPLGEGSPPLREPAPMGSYRMGPQQLTEQYSPWTDVRLDPLHDAPQYHFNTNGKGKGKSGNLKPGYNNGEGKRLSFLNGGVRPGFGINDSLVTRPNVGSYLHNSTEGPATNNSLASSPESLNYKIPYRPTGFNTTASSPHSATTSTLEGPHAKMIAAMSSPPRRPIIEGLETQYYSNPAAPQHTRAKQFALVGGHCMTGQAVRALEAEAAIEQEKRSKSEQIARMIMNGAMDDPTDPDYGNPGPSKHPFAKYKDNGADDPVTIYRTMVDKGVCVDSAGDTLGSSAAFVGKGERLPPQWYLELDEDNRTPIDVIMQDLPFIEAARMVKPSTAGVLRICDPPFACTQAEVTAFLGKNVPLVNQPAGTPFTSIHIMLNRLWGKTGDVFVEVTTVKEAARIASAFARRAKEGHHTRLGGRDVAVKLSSQQEFMESLFPHTKNCTWIGAIPHIDYNHEVFDHEMFGRMESVGFAGFLKEEEVSHMIKHVEVPHFSHYNERAPIRAWEAVITLIHKYPWYAVENVFIGEREAIFKVYILAVNALIWHLREHSGKHGKTRKVQPTIMTLKELVIAGFTCPGFSEAQKTVIYEQVHPIYGQYCTTKGLNMNFGGLDSYAEKWPFYTLIKQPGIPDGVIEFFCTIFRDATVHGKLTVQMLEAMKMGDVHIPLFGIIDVDYAGCRTLGDAGTAERRAVRDMLVLSYRIQDSMRGHNDDEHDSVFDSVFD